MPFKVTYTTNTRPTDLPAGATVEGVSALPLSFETYTLGVKVSVIKWSALVDSAEISLSHGGQRVDAEMTPSETRRVRDALTEALSETPPVEPTGSLIDGEGDPWYELVPGLYTNHETRRGAEVRRDSYSDEARRSSTLVDMTFAEIEEIYGIGS